MKRYRRRPLPGGGPTRSAIRRGLARAARLGINADAPSPPPTQASQSPFAFLPSGAWRPPIAAGGEECTPAPSTPTPTLSGVPVPSSRIRTL
jgi:hypothetical protein